MCSYAIKVWVLKKLPLEEHIHKLRTQPLVSVLRQLHAPTQPTDSHDGSLSHMRFRDLHAPTWVRNRPLTLTKARRRLQQDLFGQDLTLYCPLITCNRAYKRRASLSKHLQSKHHSEYDGLDPPLRDKMIDPQCFAWDVPAHAPFRRTVLSTTTVSEEELDELNEDE